MKVSAYHTGVCVISFLFYLFFHRVRARRADSRDGMQLAWNDCAATRGNSLQRRRGFRVSGFGGLGGGAVWFPQRRHLALCLLLLAAWSLYSPCGPFGRASTLIHIAVKGWSSKGGSVCRLASNPRLLSSSITEVANCGEPPIRVDWTTTPLSAGTSGSLNFPVARMVTIPAGGWTIIPPDRNASAISSAKSSASMSPAGYHKLAAAIDLNPVSSLPMSFFCWSVNCRNATADSTLTRASRSPSASFRNCAASLSFLAARPFASAACFSAAAAFASAAKCTSDSCALNLASAFEANP
jgi:hypothetical protein